MIDVLLVFASCTVAALVTHALWKAYRKESSQIRRVIGLALWSAASITVAKLVQLALYLGLDDVHDSTLIIDYAEKSASVVVTIGIVLLAISLLDLVMVVEHVWPRRNRPFGLRNPGESPTVESGLEHGRISAILFRRYAPIYETGASNVYLNDEIQDLLGFTRDELHSEPDLLMKRMHPDDRRSLLQGADILASPGARAILDQRFKHKNGSYRWIRTALNRIDDPSGNFSEIVGCGVDVSDLKEAQNCLAGIPNSEQRAAITEDNQPSSIDRPIPQEVDGIESQRTE